MKDVPRPPWGRPLPDARACPAPGPPPQDRALGLTVPPPLPLLAKARPGAHTWLALGRVCASRKKCCQCLLGSGLRPQVPAGVEWDQVARGTGPRSCGPQAHPRGLLHRLESNSCDMLQVWLEQALGFRWTEDSRAGAEVGGWRAVGSILASFSPVHPSSVFNELARHASPWSPALPPV